MANDPLQALSQQQNQEQQALINRLLSRVAQPRKVGPQAMLTPQQQTQLTPEPHRMVHGLFSLITNAAAQHKQEQLAHATNRIKSISDAIEDAYEHAQGDENKAKQLFMASPAVRSLQSKEGQKDIKQMEKLLQYDFLNPEKSKTVWHEALEQVARISGAEKVMKGLRGLMGQHQNKTAEEVKKQGELQHGQQQASELASTMFGAARTERMESKTVTDVLRAHAEVLRAETDLTKSRDKYDKVIGNDGIYYVDKQDPSKVFKIKSPESGESVQAPRKALDSAMSEFYTALKNGDKDTIDQKRKLVTDLAAAARPSSGIPKTALGIQWMLFDPSVPPETKAIAQKVFDHNQQAEIQKIWARGESFGWYRPLNLPMLDSATGKIEYFNYADYKKQLSAGRDLTPVAPITGQNALPVMAAAVQYKNTKQEVINNLGVFDNPDDRTLFAKVLNITGGDEEGWINNVIDQIGMNRLSPQGQDLLVGLKAKAEAFAAIRRTFGLGTTDANIKMLTSLLPGAKTGNSKVARALNKKADDYLDSLMDNPMVRPFIMATEETAPPDAAKKSKGVRTKGGASYMMDRNQNAKPAAKEDKGRVIPLD